MNNASGFSFDMSYCGPPVVPGEIWSRWNFEPFLLIGLLVLAGLGYLSLRTSERMQQVSFGAAWTISGVLFVSPLCALTVSFFAARVGHHVALTMLVAPLLALALPARWGRQLRLMPALVISTAAFWLWHSPDLYAASFAHPALYWLMQFSLLASFTWLWLGLMRGTPTAAGIAALSSAIQMGLLGALLVFAPAALYLPHFSTTLAFGVSPLDDQQLAGLIMWVPANLPLLALVLWRLMDALRQGPETTE